MRLLIIASLLPAIALAQTGSQVIAASQYAVYDCGVFTPADINKQGELVGAAMRGDGVHVMRCGVSGAYDLGLVPPSPAPVPGRNNQIFRSPRINDKGAIVWRTSDGGILIGNDGVQRPLPIFPASINVAGQVAGYVSAGGTMHAAMWQNGVLTDIGESLFGATVESYATDVNDDGAIVGYYIHDISGVTSWGYAYTMTVMDGFLLDGRLHRITYPNPVEECISFSGCEIVPMAVNNGEQVVGYFAKGFPPYSGFLWQSGSIVNQIRPLRFNYLYSINNKGQSVGWGAAGVQMATILVSNGNVYEINDLLESAASASWLLRGAYAINQSGQIAASGFVSDIYGNPSGSEHALILNPVRK